MVEFTASWACENLAKCLQVTHLKENGDDDASIFPRFDPDCVELEHCVRLERVDDETDGISDHCVVKFHSKSCDIGTLVLVSEAKRLELFKGESGEYIKTLTGSKLEGIDEDMKVYTVEENLAALSLCSLSVRLIGVSESCWIVSCQIGLLERRSGTASPGTDRFNLKQLDGVELSAKAKELRKLMETMRPQEEHNLGAVSALLPLISASFSRHSSGQEQESFSNVHKITSRGSNVASNPTTIESNQPLSTSSSCTVGSGAEVMNALSSLEERILRRIEEVRKGQDEKMDRIIAFLEQTRCTCNNPC